MSKIIDESPLNIVFLCGSLEPGKDGVGDYTRRLAAHLIRQGARVSIIAINDRHVDGRQGQQISTQPELQASDGLRVPVLRLASSLPWKQRVRLLQESLDDQRPKWISLQYVPYAYSMKGIPLILPLRLKWLKGNHCWHVMYHELWIGITASSPASHKIIGRLQRIVVKMLMLGIKPEGVSTSNPLYQYLLGKIGITAKRFPLFSSFQTDRSKSGWMVSALAELGIDSSTKSMYIIAGMFGSCHPDFPLDEQIKKLSLHATEHGKSLAILGIGGAAGTGAAWEQRVRKVAPSSIVKHFGQVEPAYISAFLSCLDLGIPATPIEYLGKSSTAAAMVHHGVKVVTSYEQDLPEYRHLHLNKWEAFDLFNTVQFVAEQYLELFAIQPSD